MSPQSILLIGGPDSGKTNYLARLWAALSSKNGKLVSSSPPNNIKYVEDALAHLLQGKFTPRSNKDLSESPEIISIPVTMNGNGEALEIVVPDVSGELWKAAVDTYQISNEWMDRLTHSTGAILFVRIMSDLNVAPLNWITSKRLLQMHGQKSEEAENIPTQVFLCELLRFLEGTLQRRKNGALPRIAVVVTAWDRLDQGRSSAGPTDYLKVEYPLFAGRLVDSEKVEVRVFGSSVVGGDLKEDESFKEKFYEGDLKKFGYIIDDSEAKSTMVSDITLPVAWVVDGI
jgi:hypothetical protein